MLSPEPLTFYLEIWALFLGVAVSNFSSAVDLQISITPISSPESAHTSKPCFQLVTFKTFKMQQRFQNFQTQDRGFEWLPQNLVPCGTFCSALSFCDASCGNQRQIPDLS